MCDPDIASSGFVTRSPFPAMTSHRIPPRRRTLAIPRFLSFSASTRSLPHSHSRPYTHCILYTTSRPRLAAPSLPMYKLSSISILATFPSHSVHQNTPHLSFLRVLILCSRVSRFPIALLSPLSPAALLRANLYILDRAYTHERVQARCCACASLNPLTAVVRDVSRLPSSGNTSATPTRHPSVVPSLTYSFLYPHGL